MTVDRIRLLLPVALLACLLATLGLHAQENTKTPGMADIAWGLERDGYRSGVWTERAIHPINSGFIVYYYVEVPEGAGKPQVARQNRNLRLLGAGRLDTRYFFPAPEAVAGQPRVYRLPLAYVASSRVGKSELICLYTITTDDGEITLLTGNMTISFVTKGEAEQNPPFLSRELSVSLMKERINMLPIPRIHYREITLRRFREHLADLHELYDPYNVAINLVWAPADLPDTQIMTLEVSDTTLEHVIEEVTIQTKYHYTVDTGAIIIHADKDIVADVEIVLDPDVHGNTMDRLRAMRLSSFTVTRRTLGSLIESLNATSRQNDPERIGASFTHELPDDVLEKKIAMDLSDVSIYEVARYIALTAGVRYKLTADGVVFLP